MTTSNDSDFRQFLGMFDADMQPRGEFATELTQRLRAEAAPPLRPPVAIATPTPVRSRLRPERRRRPFLVAAAMLVALALTVSAFWVISDESLPGQYASAPQVTLPLDASVTPGADVALQPSLLTYGPDHLRGVVGVFDGVLIGTTGSVDAERMFAIDVATGSQLWEQEDLGVGNPVVADGTLYGIVEFSSSATPSIVQNGMATTFSNQMSLAAIDLRSGDTRWVASLPSLTNDQFWMSWSQPVATDDAIYVASWNTILALDPADGSERWRVESDAALYEGPMEAVLAHHGNSLLRVASDGRVTIVNPANGELLASAHMDLEQRSAQPYQVAAASVDAGVVAIWTGPTANGIESTVALLNVHTGEVESVAKTDASSGLDAFAADGSVAYVPNQWVSGSRLLQIIGIGGHAEIRLVWVDATTGSVRLITDYARFDDARLPIVANNGDYACYMAEAYTCFDHAGTRHTVTEEAVSWAQFVDSRLYFATDSGIYTVDLP